MLLGELGRYPVEIAIKTRMVGFWNRLIHGNISKLSFWLYQCLKHSQIRSKWLLHIQHIFESLGRPDIWQLQENFYMTNLSFFAQSLLIDQYLQGWHNKASQSSKALTYFSFKSDYALENYFLSLPRKYYLNLFKFRTGNHKLPIEVGRWEGTAINERICSLCNLNDTGDEYHYLLKCPYFKPQRELLIKPYYIRRPNMLKFGEINKCKSTAVLTKLSQFMKMIMNTFK